VRPLRIGIDGRSFGSPAAGVRRYVAELVPALLREPEPLELVALGGDPATVPAGLAHVPEPWHPPTNLGWASVGLPLAAARARVDLIHAPAYTAPLWCRVPVVVTIHDVSYALHPEWYPYRRDRLRRLFYRRSARGAAHVLTVSEFSRGEIARAYGIPPSRITVTPHGVPRAFTGVETGAGARLPPGVRPPFVLHVGDLHERRNLMFLFETLVAARWRLDGTGPALVLAGVDRGVGEGLAMRAAAAGMPEAVVQLGPIDDDQLRPLYRAASALVYPSRYEGFGLPLLEAMASGTPVVASRAASIPEVVGDAGVLLDPDDAEGWTRAIVEVSSGADVRARMRDRGLARAAGFTWERAARITAGVYRQVAGRVPAEARP
jgi:glycosyltransferase involved in cell wall biosynthesis